MLPLPDDLFGRRVPPTSLPETDAAGGVFRGRHPRVNCLAMPCGQRAAPAVRDWSTSRSSMFFLDPRRTRSAAEMPRH
jgi:hypothetical protein